MPRPEQYRHSDEDAVGEPGFGSEGSLDPTDTEPENSTDSEEDNAVSQLPPPNATIPELRHALALCQKSLTETRAKLRDTKKELQTVFSSLPLRKRKAAINKLDPLNEDIVRVAKKFALLHRLWVIDSLFPVKTNQSPGADLLSAGRWDSLEEKRNAVLTELFHIMPTNLQREVTKYKSFGSVFTNTLNQERSNLLRAVKEASALVFASLALPDATILLSTARKREDPEMKRLSMKEGSYHRIAPILFADTNQMKPDGFLRNPVLVNILRLLLFGKNTLTKEKARGGPKTRGHIHGVHNVTEGLIALAAIFARYLLTPDSELQSIGGESKIPYEDDYDFYLQQLLKRSGWAIGTVNFFNKQLFGNKKSSMEQAAPSIPARTWEDDFLNDLDNADGDVVQVLEQSSPGPLFVISDIYRSQTPNPSSPSFASPSESLPSSQFRNADPSQTTASNSMVSIHNHPGASLSSVSRLQVEVGQMNISSGNPRQDPTNGQPAPVSGPGNRRVLSGRRAPIPIHAADANGPPEPVATEPFIPIQKRTTRARAKTAGKK